MKKILDKFDQIRLGHKLHQLQKRHKRAEMNGYGDKLEIYTRRIEEIQEKLRHIKSDKH
jgi:hypothetical protein